MLDNFWICPYVIHGHSHSISFGILRTWISVEKTMAVAETFDSDLFVAAYLEQTSWIFGDVCGEIPPACRIKFVECVDLSFHNACRW